MTTTTMIDTSWLEVERMTDTMQQAANGGDWIEVLELAAARHHRVVEHFESYPVGPTTADYYRQRLSNMLKNEESLQLLVRNARKSLMREGLTMKHNHQAVGAYINNAL